MEEITQRFKLQPSAPTSGLRELVQDLKLDPLRGEGFIHIDGGEVSNEDKPADLTMTLSKADLEALARAAVFDPHEAR